MILSNYEILKKKPDDSYVSEGNLLLEKLVVIFEESCMETNIILESKTIYVTVDHPFWFLGVEK